MNFLERNLDPWSAAIARYHECKFIVHVGGQRQDQTVDLKIERHFVIG